MNGVWCFCEPHQDRNHADQDPHHAHEDHHHDHHQEHDLPPQSLSSLLSQLLNPAFLWRCLLLEECFEQFKDVFCLLQTLLFPQSIELFLL